MGAGREPVHPAGAAAAAAGGVTTSKYGTNAAHGVRYLMKGSLVQRIDKYREMAGIKPETLKPAKTPSLDENNFTDEDLVEKRALGTCGSKCSHADSIHCQVRKMWHAVLGLLSSKGGHQVDQGV